MLPKVGIALGDDLGVVNGKAWVADSGKCHRHGDAVVAVRVDDGTLFSRASGEVPTNGIVTLDIEEIAQLAKFGAQGFQTVTLFVP